MSERMAITLERIADALETLVGVDAEVVIEDVDKGDQPILLKVEEAARLLRISRGEAYALAASGDWPVVRFGRSVRIHRAKLEEMVSQGNGVHGR